MLIGLAAGGLAGYALLLFSGSAVAIIPGILALGLITEAWLRRRPAGTRELEGPVAVYRRFRSTWAGRICWVVLAIGALIVLIARFGWLTGRTTDGVVEIGTRVYDDMRTIGFPISLAAFGTPLRNPLAAETMLMYPLGAFILPAGMVALRPSFALHAIIADTVVISLLFAFVLMLFAAWLARKDDGWHTAAAILFAVSCIFSVAFHWGEWEWVRKSAWYPVLFTFVREGISTTVGNTTLIGLVMLGNHALSYTMYLAVGLLLPALPLAVLAMLTTFAAATSMDMSIFALVAAGLYLAWHVATTRQWPWRLILLAALAAAVVGLIMLPGLTGRMDGLKPPAPSFLRYNLHPLGAVLCTEGPYFLILAAALPFVTGRARLIPLLAACFAPLPFLLAYHYGSFWFWRGHFAMHSLLSLLCLAAIASIRQNRIRTAVLSLWALAVLPGIWHNWQDIRWFRKASGTASAAQAEAIRWIYANTRLQDLVAAWKPDEQSLVPKEDYLRAGSRSGKVVYDRTHVVMGYQKNFELMSDLARGIAGNDYIVYFKDDPAMEQILKKCSAPVVFRNSGTIIYRIDGNCRGGLALLPGDPLTAHFQGFASYLVAHPEQAQMLVRKRAEMFWQKTQYGAAISMLTTAAERSPNVGEIHYSLGYSLQQDGRNAEAVASFTRALELGYYEFWTRYARGASLLALGEKAKAAEDLRRATQLDPAHQGAKNLLAQALR